MDGQAHHSLAEFLAHPLVLSVIFSWFSAQAIKTMIGLVTRKVHTLKDLFALLVWRTGGMPSSHSSLVVAVTTSIGFRNGINSDIFILSLVLALITVRDALGVRRASGIQAHVINEMGMELAEKKLIDYKAIKEVHGHKPLEVAVGCVLGFFIGVACSSL